MAGAGKGTIITFAPELAKQPIVLTSEIAISASLMIDGGGAITVSGGTKTRIFRVTCKGEVVLRGLTLIDGNAVGEGVEGNGGAIRTGGHAGLVRVDRCTLRGNVARGEGDGGIWQGWRGCTMVTDYTFTATTVATTPRRVSAAAAPSPSITRAR